MTGLWRGVVGVWVVLVVVGGGLTWWLRDSGGAEVPKGREATYERSLPGGWESRCPPLPTDTSDPGQVTDYLCIVRTR